MTEPTRPEEAIRRLNNNPDEPQLALVDGRDALGAAIIRPKNPDNLTDGVEVEAFASGLPHPQMAKILRQVADHFDQRDQEPGPAADDTAPGRP